MKNSSRVARSNIDKINYIVLNFFAYVVNFLSGLILARKLGPEGRGIYSYLSNFYLITLFLAPLNSKNAASIAQSELLSNRKPVLDKLQNSKFFLMSFGITFMLSLCYFIFLRGKFENRIVMIFCLSNLMNSIAILNQIQEGKLRTNNSLRPLSILRFLAYATPSLLIFLLYFLHQVKVEYVILGQAVAMASCFLYLFLSSSLTVDFSRQSFKSGSIKTYASFGAEFFVNCLPLFLVGYSEKLGYLGVFTIAFGYSLISDTYFQVIESKMYFDLSTHDIGLTEKVTRFFPKSLRNLAISQSIFLPGAYLIPYLYGNSYRESSLLAVLLIISKFLFSIVKIENIYFNLVFSKFKLPVFLNFSYIGIALSAYFICWRFANFEHPWIFSLLLASLLSPVIGGFLVLREIRRYSTDD